MNHDKDYMNELIQLSLHSPNFCRNKESEDTDFFKNDGAVGFVYSIQNTNNTNSLDEIQQSMRAANDSVDDLRILKNESFTDELSKAIKIMFFRRNKLFDGNDDQHINDNQDNKRPSKVMEYGCLTKCSSSNASLITRDILIPLLESEISATSDCNDSMNAKFASKFSAAVVNATKEYDEGSKFRFLKNSLTEMGKISDDHDSIQKLEASMLSWCHMVNSLLEVEKQRKTIVINPLAECEFWRQRQMNLSGIQSQTELPAVKESIEELYLAGSTNIQKSLEIFSELNHLTIEAKDNTKFLSTLERYFQTISHGSIFEIHKIIPSLLDSIRIIWIVSRHYNRDERLAPLMESIANELVKRVKETIDLKTILRSDPKFAAELIGEAKKMLNCWRQMYMSVRAQIEEGGAGQRRWEFDRGRLFEKTDYCAVVCDDLHKAVIIIEQFHCFLETELTGVTSVNDETNVVVHEVKKLPLLFEESNFDLFDFGQSERRSEVMKIFNEKVHYIENISRIFIENSFQKLKSAYGAFQLVERFKEIHSRPSIHRLIEKRYDDIIEQYDRELGHIDKSFQKRRNNPPVAICYNKFSGSIVWAEDLYHKAKRTIIRLRLSDELLLSGFGNTVKHRYLRFARSIDSYKEHLFSKWQSSVDSSIADRLNQPILSEIYHRPIDMRSKMGERVGCHYKDLRSSSFLHSKFGQVLFRSNFPPDVFKFISEAKIFARMGYKIPDCLLVAALQEESYNRCIMELDLLAIVYNKIISSLSTVEFELLRRHLRTLTQAIKPGLTTLNWTSQRIHAFVISANHAVESFQSLLMEVRKHATAIDDIILSIETSCLICEEDFISNSICSITLLEFSDIFDLKLSKKLDHLVRLYSSIKPLLLNVEMSVSESDCGLAPSLQGYYLYWEKRMHNAVVQMIVRSLKRFVSLIKSCSTNRPLCKINVIRNGQNLILTPSLNDIDKQMNRCVLMLLNSAKKFLRWMKGTCIDTPEQNLFDGSNETSFFYSFYDDVSHNLIVANTVIHVNNELNHIYGDMSRYINLWQQCEASLHLWDPKRKVWMDALFEMNVPFFLLRMLITDFEVLRNHFINANGTQENEVYKHPTDKEKKNVFFSLDFTHLFITLAAQAQNWKDDLIEVLHVSAKYLLDSFTTTVKRLQKNLNNDLQNLDDFKIVLNTITEISDLHMEMENNSRNIKEMYETLNLHSNDIIRDEIDASISLNFLWSKLVSESRVKFYELSDIKEEYRKQIICLSQDFVRNIDRIFKEFSETGPGSSKISLDEGLIQIDQWSKKEQELNTELDVLNNDEHLFGLPLTSNTSLTKLRLDIVDLKHIYNLYREFKEFQRLQSFCYWNRLDAPILQKSVQALQQKCAQLKSCKDRATFNKVESCIKYVIDALPSIVALKNSAIHVRHWEKLAHLSGAKIDLKSETMTLKHVLDLRLSEFPDEVEIIIDEATQENSIDMTIKDIQNFWENKDLNIQKYIKNGVEKGFILRKSEDINIQLEDHILNLQTIGSSRYLQAFQDRVVKWGRCLNTITECLETWHLVQQKWMYLESIFASAEDIRLQLPDEANKFDSVTKSFMILMKKTNQDRNIVNACCAENRFGSLINLLTRLDFCQNGLSEYLDTKRNSFPRFYFFSDNELLSILGNHDPTDIQMHLMKIFDNVESLRFTKSMNQVCGMISSEGESFSFTKSVPLDGLIERWMVNVEEEMRKSLWAITKESVFRYSNDTRTKWIASEKKLGMTLINASQIWWAWQVEDCFRRMSKGEKYALKKLEADLTNELFEMIAMVRSPLTKIARKKVNNLLIIDIHARENVSSFVKECIFSAKQFEWESKLRFYWSRVDDNCVIRQCSGNFSYGYEYLGLSDRLVITPLTGRCYMILTQAITFCLGGSLVGPAGTGKTETVKDLSKAFAHPCFVINCGEGLDYKAMGAIFSGLVQCGAWGCFDEFNRINIEVLSVVAAQIKSIQNAFMCDSPMVDIGFGHDLQIKRLNGQPTSAFFVTMNPGYIGRTELPANLKILFRPITMIIPDSQQIAENLLFSEGFDNSKILSKKIVILYHLCKEQLSQQHHYDFGLRSIKSALAMAGTLKRQHTKTPEHLLLMKILRDANIPKFVFDDVPIFHGLIQDLFPGGTCSRTSFEDFKKAISYDLEKNGFECSDHNINDGQIDKILQIYETQIVRHTTMIVGPTGGGKSVALQTLCNAHFNFDGTSIKSFIINPKAQNLNELYGEMDPTTHDWTDGVLSRIFREINQPIPSGREKEVRWIIFDGDVDSLWIENMNSVMDDNRLLTLPNGERIRLQPYCAIICEVFDLQYASPATISRCGMVWMDPKNLGFRPIFDRWLLYRLKIKKTFDSSHHKSIMLRFFEKLFVPCLNLVMKGEKNCAILSTIVPVGEIHICKQFCCLLDSFLPIDCQELSEDDIESICVHSIIWSIGALLCDKSRAEFDLFVKEISTITAPDGSLYEYFYSIDEQKWIKWWSQVPDYVEPVPFQYHDIMVPTATSVLYKDLLKRFVPKKPVLLVGNCGSAKTFMLENYMRSLTQNKFAKLTMNFSYRTTSRDVLQHIEGKVDKRVGNIYGPTSQKKLVVSIEDMNMPRMDSYGTQQPIAFLLTLIDHGLTYTRGKEKSKIYIRDLQFLAAMCPSGGGRNPTDPRFLSRFNLFHITSPSEQVCLTIFSNILRVRLIEFGDNFVNASKLITSATLSFYQFIIHALLPTPSKFHYTFNMKDLSRVFEGLCYATREKIQTECGLIRLWRNEMYRVFFDRLINTEDFTIADCKLREIVTTSFKSCSKEALRDPLVFGDFENVVHQAVEKTEYPRLYGDLDTYSKARKIFLEMMELYNITNKSKPLSLILFDMAISHLIRLMRILKHSRGNALLMGIEGSGKQSISRLAAYTCGYEIICTTSSRLFGENQFKDDLRGLYRKLINEPIVFLVTDASMNEEYVLEYINNMLTIGIPPGLFEDDEKIAICERVRCQAIECQVSHDQESLWDFCIEVFRRNLHVVIAMSPSGEKLRFRCRNFPGILSSCTVDYFFPWPEEALEEVSTRLLEHNTNIPDTMRAIIAKHIAFVHLSVTKEAEKFRATQHRNYFVTTKNYLDFISNYQNQLRKSLKKMNGSIKRLENGLFRLVEATSKVNRMQVELERKKVILKSKTDSVEYLIKEMQHKTISATKSNNEVNAKREYAETQRKVISEEKDRAASALMAALPEVEAAVEALNNIKREDLQELKAFNDPPIHVKIVCQMCAVLRPTNENLDETWSDSKKLLGNSRLLDYLKDYPKDSITEKMYRSCKKILQDNMKYDVTVENMATKSKAGTGLLVWVFAILRYYEIAKDVDPLREKVKTMEKSLIITEHDLINLQNTQILLNDELNRLQLDLENANKELSSLQYQTSTLEKRLNIASKLVTGLQLERARWDREVNELNEKKGRLLGDCLLGATFLSYVGAFTADIRSNLLHFCFTTDMEKRGIPQSQNPGFKIQYLFTDDVTIQHWNANGLPKDEQSIENGILTMNGSRFPLCIDPQQQALTWIKRTYSTKQLSVMSLEDENFMKHIQLAIQLGNPILFENVSEEIDSILDPILEKNIVLDGEKKVIILGGKSIAWNDNFRLYFCTRLSNPRYSPEIIGKLTLINYCVTQDGLGNQLLNLVVSHEKPELETQFGNLVSEMEENSQLLAKLEDTLLRELSSSSGIILDNKELIVTLEDIQYKAIDLRAKITQAEKAHKEINDARNKYRSVSRRGSMLYFSTSRLSIINAMYDISLDFFLNLFINSLKDAKEDSAFHNRLKHLINSCTVKIYDTICTGIFERHKLTYTFILTCMILKEEERIDPYFLDFFLKGDISFSSTSETKPLGAEWISDSAWKNLVTLAQLHDVFIALKEDISNSMEVFKKWYDLETPEASNMRLQSYTKLSPIQKLCLIRVFRPDRCYFAVKIFIKKEMGDHFVQPSMIDYEKIYNQSSPNNPILFILSPGANPLADIQYLGEKFHFTASHKFRSISLGQNQGPVALKVLRTSFSRGHWVLLQNCHLLIPWLSTLDNVLDGMKAPHNDFRLWLTTEPNDKFPLGLLRRSLKVVTEPPNGMKYKMKNIVSKINQEIINECPHPNFYPLLYVLIYLHAVVKERQKYGKIGWNVSYDFNESDFSISRKLMSLYLSKAYEDQEESIPWESLKFLIGDAMYGGRVCDDMDRRILSTYLDEYMGDFLFEKTSSFFFSQEGHKYILPNDENRSIESYEELIDQFPLWNSPAVFGLHPNAEIGYFESYTNEMLADLLLLQPKSGEEKATINPEEKLMKIVDGLLNKLPNINNGKECYNIECLREFFSQRNEMKLLSPRERVLLQELERWNKLCEHMLQTLLLSKQALRGEIGMNNCLEKLIKSLSCGLFPQCWSKLAPQTKKKLGGWMTHFEKRYIQYEKWVNEGEPKVMWLSGLHVPESYISALAQTSCRRNGWPLDKSFISTYVTKYKNVDEIEGHCKNDDEYYISGLYLEGAGWDFERAQLRKQDPKILFVELPIVKVVPIRCNEIRYKNTFQTPVYVTCDRRNAVGSGFVFNTFLVTDVHPGIWTLNGVAITLNLTD